MIGEPGLLQVYSHVTKRILCSGCFNLHLLTSPSASVPSPVSLIPCFRRSKRGFRQVQREGTEYNRESSLGGWAEGGAGWRDSASDSSRHPLSFPLLRYAAPLVQGSTGLCCGFAGMDSSHRLPTATHATGRSRLPPHSRSAWPADMF